MLGMLKKLWFGAASELRGIWHHGIPHKPSLRWTAGSVMGMWMAKRKGRVVSRDGRRNKDKPNDLLSSNFLLRLSCRLDEVV